MQKRRPLILRALLTDATDNTVEGIVQGITLNGTFTFK